MHPALRDDEEVITRALQTPVSQTPYFILMHPGVFPQPEVFRPERWLEQDEKAPKLDRYLVSFGKGSRQCVGLK